MKTPIIVALLALIVSINTANAQVYQTIQGQYYLPLEDSFPSEQLHEYESLIGESGQTMFGQAYDLQTGLPVTLTFDFYSKKFVAPYPVMVTTLFCRTDSVTNLAVNKIKKSNPVKPAEIWLTFDVPSGVNEYKVRYRKGGSQWVDTIVNVTNPRIDVEDGETYQIQARLQTAILGNGECYSKYTMPIVVSVPMLMVQFDEVPKQQGIFDLTGRKLSVSREELPAGIYVIDGEKVGIIK